MMAADAARTQSFLPADIHDMKTIESISAGYGHGPVGKAANKISKTCVQTARQTTVNTPDIFSFFSPCYRFCSLANF
jgi:hypothetical protein